ncbi:MAG: carboxymuconolactone decarboxylase family protein [Tepidisphaera sp.]|nr:carboxymuconolactone decarboxylase family protein [Tepidisphaera sp.]
MARIATINPATATGSVKHTFDNLQKALGLVPNLHKTVANSPAALQAYVSFAGALAGGVLDPKIREQIAILSAQTNSCEYCLSAHTLLGKGAGVSAADLDGARKATATDPKAAAALAFAQRVLSDRGQISPEDVQKARKAGLSDAELSEIVAHVGLNVFTNYFNSAFDTDLDFPRVAINR